MIARTEMNRSYNNGAIQTYVTYGIKQFNIINYHDWGICTTCISHIQNNPHTLDEILTILPVHPNCKCIVTAAETNEKIEKQHNPIIINMFKKHKKTVFLY